MRCPRSIHMEGRSCFYERWSWHCLLRGRRHASSGFTLGRGGRFRSGMGWQSFAQDDGGIKGLYSAWGIDSKGGSSCGGCIEVTWAPQQQMASTIVVLTLKRGGIIL